MSSQDKLERVLRDIHVMISRSEPYDAEHIIISKKDVFDLIDRLNASVYEIMDEYELTQQSREKALRENKREGDKIIWSANRQAEDIYAASVLYTDEALNHLNGIIDYANDTIGKLYKEFKNSMREQQEMIHDNQEELKTQLRFLAETEKYLGIIEDRNREIERERMHGKDGIAASKSKKAPAADILSEQEGAQAAEWMEPLADEGVIESTLKKEVQEDWEAQARAEDTISLQQKKAIEDNIKVNLDSEYFKWKNDGAPEEYTQEERREKASLLDRLMGRKKNGLY